jgi:hypothetical protein
MRAAGLWIPRKERAPRVHQPYNRRACLGELVQIDGSAHRRAAISSTDYVGAPFRHKLRGIGWATRLMKESVRWTHSETT